MSTLLMEKGVVAYGANPVVAVDRFEADPGRVVVIHGGNGTGKTSLFRAVMGFAAHFSGQLSYEGKTLDNLATHERVLHGIRLLPQERRVFGRLTPIDHMAMADRLLTMNTFARPPATKTSPPATPEVCRRSGSASHLSGGEAKMMLLTALTKGDVRLLLLDEVFASLDPTAIETVVQIIEGCVGRGAACIVADHTGIAERLLDPERCFSLSPACSDRAMYELHEEI